jgi:hypothetical protein
MLERRSVVDETAPPFKYRNVKTPNGTSAAPVYRALADASMPPDRCCLSHALR